MVFESAEAVGGLGAGALRWLGMVTLCCSLVCSHQYQLIMRDERVMMMHGACAMRDAAGVLVPACVCFVLFSRVLRPVTSHQRGL